MNSLGSKDIKQVSKIFDSLQANGISIITIVSNLTTFYSALLNSYNNENEISYHLNNTIKKRIPTYKGKYTFEEITNIIIELRNIDIIAKSSSIDDSLLFSPFALKICKGYYD